MGYALHLPQRASHPPRHSLIKANAFVRIDATSFPMMNGSGGSAFHLPLQLSATAHQTPGRRLPTDDASSEVAALAAARFGDYVARFGAIFGAEPACRSAV